MKVIVMLDDANGMMFNKRRQSQDSVLRKDILSDSKDVTLWMNEYSSAQFTEDNANISVSEDFLNKASDTEYCLVENIHLSSYIEKINEIVVYRWNRMYPSDFKFDIQLEEPMWSMVSTIDFVGSSHDKITKEVWMRNV